MRLHLRLVGVLIALLIGASAAPNALAASKWRGHDRPCKVKLKDTSEYRTVPLPSKQVGAYTWHWVLKGHVNWDDPNYTNSGSLKFHTCPPKRMLLIGDSIAFTLGVPWLNNEADYGVELANGAILGCGYGDRGEFYNRTDRPYPLPAVCEHAYQQWQDAANRFHAKEVIVELGFRDEFDWLWGTHTVHLGKKQFDSFVRSNIEELIRTLGKNGRKILFLTVPYVEPRKWPNGEPDPSSTPSRHRAINAMIRSIAHKHRHNVAVYDIDKTISPGDHYNTYVHGTFCRRDGVHFTTACSDMLEPYVLNAARELLRR